MSPKVGVIPGPGRGVIETVTGTDPGAGSEISETVPAGEIWVVYAFRASLTTGSAAGTRTPELVLDDGTNVFLRREATSGQAAGTTVAYSAADYGAVAGPSGQADELIILPPVPLVEGDRIRTVTNNLGGADNWSAPVLKVEKLADVITYDS